MTQPKENILILHEGINRIIVKRAGATFEVGCFALTKDDNDNYHVGYANNSETTNVFHFNNRKFYNGKNLIDDRKSYLYN